MTLKAAPMAVGVVVVGKFNPAMFHPSLFKEYGLFGKQETEAATNHGNVMVGNNQSMFSISGIDFVFTRDHLQIVTAREDLHNPLYDCVISLLALLDITPVSALGINWECNIPAADDSSWHAFGDRLAPKEFWKSRWNGRAGLANLQIQLLRTDKREGTVNFSISPTPGSVSVSAKMNDHYGMSGKDAQAASKLITEVWSQSRAEGIKFIEEIQKEMNRV